MAGYGSKEVRVQTGSATLHTQFLKLVPLPYSQATMLATSASASATCVRLADPFACRTCLPSCCLRAAREPRLNNSGCLCGSSLTLASATKAVAAWLTGMISILATLGRPQLSSAQVSMLQQQHGKFWTGLFFSD